MIKQKQAFRHRPDEGIWGDCFRTAVACLLELPRDEVPHVFEGGVKGQDADRAMNAWLAKRGLTQFVHVAEGEIGLDELLSRIAQVQFGNQPEYLLTGKSRNGTDHVVVCRGGEIVWDPALDDSGIIGPCEDGFFWITAIAVTRPTKEPEAA